MKNLAMLVSVTITVALCMGCVQASEWDATLELADSLAAQGMADSAEATLSKAMELALRHDESSDTTLGICFEDETGDPEICFFRSFAEAETLLVRAIRIREGMLESDDAVVASFWHRLGRTYEGHGKLQEARHAYGRSVEVGTGISGSHSRGVGRSLDGLAGTALGLQELGVAKDLSDSSIAIIESTAGVESYDYSTCLLTQSRIAQAEAGYAAAESLILEAMDVRQAILGEQHPSVMLCKISLASARRMQRAGGEARELCVQALGPLEEGFGGLSPVVGGTYQLLGLLAGQSRDLLEAEERLNRALYIRSTSLGLDNRHTLATMNALGWTLYVSGKLEEAEVQHRKTLAARERALGPDHPDVAWSLNNVAICCLDRGSRAEAEELLERSLAIREKALGPNHPYVVHTASLLGLCLHRQLRYDEAVEMYEYVLEIRERTSGPESPEVASSLVSLTEVLYARGDLAEAEEVLHRAMSIYEKTYGAEFSTSSALELLGRLRMEQGDFARAESLLVQSALVTQAAVGPEHPDMFYPLLALGSLYTDVGSYAEADSVLTLALDIQQRALGLDDFLTAYTLESICRVYRLQDRVPEALAISKRVYEIRRDNFTFNAAVLTESQALTYTDEIRFTTDLYLSCLLDLGYEAGLDIEDALDIIISGKGQVSDGIFNRSRVLVEEGDPLASAVTDTLRLVKVTLSNLFTEGPGENPESYATQVDSLRSLAGDLERRLARLSESYREHSESQNVDYAGILESLPEDAVLVEYLKYSYIDAESEESLPRYLAVAIGSGQEPVIVDLGEAANTDATVEAYRAHMQRIAHSGKPPTVVDRIEYADLSRSLHAAVWEPLAGRVEGRETILISPDGALNLVSFAGLVGPEGEYLVESCPIHYLSSGRDLIRLGSTPDTGRGLFALGAPDFDSDSNGRQEAAESHPDGEPELLAMRALRSSCPDFQSMSVDPLPGSRSEVERVTESWKAREKDPVRLYLGPDASEENFKMYAPGSRVIHLATHGYFIGGACKQERRSRSRHREDEYEGENPLLLSGLLFAGCNLRGSNTGSEDGILTAYEVSALDLKGTELVVLSACETGLGEVAEGEGVYGLRRAFQMAGARTVVSALWPVSDEATAEMMSSIYEDDERSLADAIRTRQMKMIRSLREQGSIDHPFLWAPFLALGDWK